MSNLRPKFVSQAIFTFCFVITLAADSQAQNGCSRCVAPIAGGVSNRPLSPWNGMATRYRSDRVRIDSTPPVSTPYYSSDPADSESGEQSLFAPMQRENRRLIPTESVTPAPHAKDLPDVSKNPRANPSKPTIAEKIGQRYSDPRVIRMLQQLTNQTAESFYQEVSELIDERHLQPATYTRRVDNALDHLIRAVEVPSFVTAAHVQGTAAEISIFQQELQSLRSQLRIRNSRDALAVMRDVQMKSAKTIAIKPAAIGLEFLYGATDSLDQFSMLLPPEKTGGPSVGLRDNVVGIGVEIESNPAGLKILKLIPGGPAAQADLRSGDIITHIDGRVLKGFDLNRSVDFIVGPVGTPIQIQASRGNRTGSVTLMRQKMALHSVVDVRMQDTTQGIGYLKLEQFAESTMSEIDTALMNLHRQGMKSLILDLRGNPGGLLTTAIALSDRFLPAGTIVATRGRTPDDNTRETAHYGNTWKMPLVVLIDHNSASASEIFAAAIQDNHRGVIVGEKSYGKGTVQTLFPLHTVPAALRLTTAKFYSPEGREMAGAGVTPDVKVSGDATETGSADKSLNEALRQILNPQTRAMSERFRRSGEVADENRLSV
jgi:carboxyl-terminal processing protease